MPKKVREAVAAVANFATQSKTLKGVSTKAPKAAKVPKAPKTTLVKTELAQPAHQPESNMSKYLSDQIHAAVIKALSETIVDSSPALPEKKTAAPRSLTSYMLFKRDFSVGKEKVKARELAKESAAKWEMLSLEEKKVYVARASALKADKEQAKEQARGPKKPLSSFMLYSLEERPKVLAANSELKPRQVAAEIGKRWAALDPLVKEHYQAIYKANKEEFERMHLSAASE